MDAVETIYLLAASLWIVVVLGALCVGIRLALKVRARRRRVNRLLDATFLALGLARSGRRPGTAVPFARLLPEFVRPEPPKRVKRRA